VIEIDSACGLIIYRRDHSPREQQLTRLLLVSKTNPLVRLPGTGGSGTASKFYSRLNPGPVTDVCCHLRLLSVLCSSSKSVVKGKLVPNIR
jgi:hypothetical protein